MNIDRQFSAKLEEINEILRRNNVLFRLREMIIGEVTSKHVEFLEKIRARFQAEYEDA